MACGGSGQCRARLLAAEVLRVGLLEPLVAGNAARLLEAEGRNIRSLRDSTKSVIVMRGSHQLPAF